MKFNPISANPINKQVQQKAASSIVPFAKKPSINKESASYGRTPLPDSRHSSIKKTAKKEPFISFLIPGLSQFKNGKPVGGVLLLSSIFTSSTVLASKFNSKIGQMKNIPSVKDLAESFTRKDAITAFGAFGALLALNLINIVSVHKQNKKNSLTS